MAKLKILIPLEGTEKSMDSINWLKKSYNKDDVEVGLINVVEIVYTNDLLAVTDLNNRKVESGKILDKAAAELDGYAVLKRTVIGPSVYEILREAESGGYNMIAMQKSTKTGLSRVLGSVPSKIIRSSPIPVVIIPE